jgi:hypothetical protein
MSHDLSYAFIGMITKLYHRGGGVARGLGQGHSVFVEALHDRFPKAIKGCVRGGALLARHPPREPQPSPKVEPDDTISPSAH